MDVKKKIQESTKKDEEKIKQTQQEYFRKLYDLKKTYQFKNHPDMKKHFYFPTIHEYFTMSKQAIAVYPIFCSLADFYDIEKPVRISRENLAKASGTATQTVDKGIKDLETYRFTTEVEGKELVCPYLTRERVIEGKRRFYEYYVGSIRGELFNYFSPHRYFRFHNCIIEKGIWKELSLRAKVMYVAFRSVAEFNKKAYRDLQDKNGTLKNRLWDVSDKPVKHICNIAGISPQHTEQPIQQLTHYRLIERMDRTIYKVWLVPE